MTSHWPSPWPPEAPVRDASGWNRTGVFDLDVVRHGGRSAIGRQHVSYPFHLTRPFSLDAAIPALLTVYQQSSSGGLYRADRLSCRYRLAAGAACHVTTQAATVVHDCQGLPARQACEVALEEGAFLALTPDPYVLFPGASVSSRLEARLAPDAVLLIAEAFAMHDPQGEGRPFDRLASDTSIRDEAGRLMVRDCFRIEGSDLTGAASPIGRWRIIASFLLLGPPSRLPGRDELAAPGADADAVIGVTATANGAGWGVRCLAADAVAARRVGEDIFAACVRAAFGHAPAARRK
ncbi:MAG: urease accessory protein UreD [Parvibaculaceae bacterium]